MRAVSTLAEEVSRRDGAAGARPTAGARWAAGGRAPARAVVSRRAVVSLRAVVSRSRLSESATVRARAWIEANTAGVYNAPTATGVESGRGTAPTLAVSSARA